MKNILKYLLLSLFFVSITSCDNEDQEQLVIIPSGSGEITAPATGAKYVLNPEEESTNPALTLTWNAADYGNPTEIKYTVQFALAGTEFADPFIAGSTTNLNLTWNIQEFNGACVSSGLAPFVEGDLDIRVISSVGSNDVEQQVSQTVTIVVVPFTTDLPKISVPGNHQGWDPASAPTLAASAFGETDYQGYVWLDGEFKFTAPNDQGNFNWDLNWGDDGTYTGILKENASDNCKADPTGYYFVKANTDELKYSIQAVSWGIIGAATPTGWDSDTDLIYDATSRTLSVNINLVPGAFKFRGNNEWGAFDLGTVDADGFLQNGGDLTFDGAAGNYKVVLDLSNPREYTYSITAN
jgi:hypothetical protein